jgi:multidrug efflux system membrane fusion protein
VVPASAVSAAVGTFSCVIGPDNVATAKPVVVTQQNENDAVIASRLSTSDRVVTTGCRSCPTARGSDRHR